MNRSSIDNRQDLWVRTGDYAILVNIALGVDVVVGNA
jgi:hypothetical protein